MSRTWRDEFRVHPAAEVFPMLPEDELQKLGEDIRVHGLREPIVFFLSAQAGTLLLDGRNRLAAMEMAGMSLAEFDREQYTKTLTNIDPYAFVISKNLRRRHLSKAEQVDIIIRVEKERESTDVIKNIISVGRDSKGQLQGSTKDPLRERVIEQAKDLHISKASVEKGFARERMGPADQILAGLEKKKHKRRHPASLQNLKYPGTLTAEVAPPDNGLRYCHASCCNGETEIRGQWNEHEAQSLLDEQGFPCGYFGKDHKAVLDFGVKCHEARLLAQVRGGPAPSAD